MVLEPNYAAAKRLLEHGHMLANAHRHLDAACVYRQALHHCPYLREAHLALACYYEQCGLLTRAADSLRSASKLQADLPSLYQLAQLLSKLERFDEALETYQHCLALAPNNPTLLYELLLTRCRLGEYSSVLEELDAHSDLRPWQQACLRGYCLEGLQRYNEAREAFQAALAESENPTSQTIVADIARIEQRQSEQQHRSLPDLLAQSNCIYLGNTCEKGLPRPIESHYHFTYPDIARTLHCLQTLHRQQPWSWKVIVSLDKTSQPLANAIAQLFDLPLRSLNDLRPDDSALIVATSSHNGDIFRLATERIPCAFTSFCLSFQEQASRQVIPDIIGVISQHHATLPWEAELRKLRSTAAPVEHIQACLSQVCNAIIQALASLTAQSQPSPSAHPNHSLSQRPQISPA